MLETSAKNDFGGGSNSYVIDGSLVLALGCVNYRDGKTCKLIEPGPGVLKRRMGLKICVTDDKFLPAAQQAAGLQAAFHLLHLHQQSSKSLKID